MERSPRAQRLPKKVRCCCFPASTVKGADNFEAGHVGGLHAHGKKTDEEKEEAGRDESGKFLPGSEAAKEGMGSLRLSFR